MKLLKYEVCLLLILSNPSYANVIATLEVPSLNKSLKMVSIGRQYRVSLNCLKTKTCEAKKAIKKFKGKKLRLNLEGGRNPGSMICNKIGGKVLIASERKGKEKGPFAILKTIEALSTALF